MAVDVYCVPDTNFFHHFQFFADVDWLNLMQAPLVNVVLTAPVLEELERHKNDNTSNRRRDRSRSALRKFDELLGESQDETSARLKDDTFLKVDLEAVDRSFYDNGLDSRLPDDRIIAHALRLRDETGQHVILVTDDIGMRIKASTRGLDVLRPPEGLQLGDEPTDPERELRRIRAATPKLNLSFWIGGSMTETALYTPRRAELSAAQVEEAAALRKKELILRSRSRGVIQGVRFPFEEREVDAYIPAYEDYLRRVSQFAKGAFYFVSVPLAILNDSSVPAEDVTVDIALGGDWLLLAEDAKIERPLEPPLPAFATRGYQRLITPAPRSEIGAPSFAQGRWEYLSDRTARLRLPRLVHGVVEPLDTLNAILTSAADVKLLVEYSLHASNCPEAATRERTVSVNWLELDDAEATDRHQ